MQKRLFFAGCLLALTLTSLQQANAQHPIASKHAITSNRPAPGFFEGALLGNGGMGVVVCTRPDAVVIYLGHNNVWDIRIAEDHREELGTFNYVFDKVKNIPSNLEHLSNDPWYNNYLRIAGSNYSKPYPRPFPCGSIILGFDRRKVELTGHTLDISNGRCTVKLLTADKKELHLQLFTDMERDRLLMQLTDSKGAPANNIFNRVKLIADPSTPGDFPQREETELLENGLLTFRQTLPSQEPKAYKGSHPDDRAFRTSIQVNGALSKKDRINWSGNSEQMSRLEAALPSNQSFLAEVRIEEGMSTAISAKAAPGAALTPASFRDAAAASLSTWNKYWAKSSVSLDDPFLEQTWYRNLYFFNCAAKDGITCPGLFANWSYNNIGTAWHGDYHMNYNTQQPFWATFSSNHLEKNLPYVNLVEFLMPVSQKWAKEYYELPGAYFPHSAFPVKMTMNPYPVPDWGWEVCETPWTVQGVWWHYLYSGDTAFLRNRAFAPIKAATEFVAAYMQRPDARGGERWKDDKYHIFPTVPPELYGLRPGFQYNYDCNVDLTLTRFLFNAFREAAHTLGVEKEEAQLLQSIQQILAHYPEYPMAESKERGKVFVSVPGEHSQVVYNAPLPLFAVFPGEHYGLHTNTDTFNILKNTYLNQQNEGGNDLVFINLQAARLGMLDIEAFKRHVNYCLLPNGTATDKVVQTMGRYGDGTDFAYMAGMGIWFENFALPAVINECLMQGYNGTIRLFPNWPEEKNASFTTLRAAGAFLVSAAQEKGKVTKVEIISEKGNELKVLIPWKNGGIVERNGKKESVSGGVVKMGTSVGERIVLREK